MFQHEFRLINLNFILAFIPILMHLQTINKIDKALAEFDPELKKVELSTFLFNIFLLLHNKIIHYSFWWTF